MDEICSLFFSVFHSFNLLYSIPFVTKSSFVKKCTLNSIYFITSIKKYKRQCFIFQYIQSILVYSFL